VAKTPRARLQSGASRTISTGYNTFSSGISRSCRQHRARIVVELFSRERKGAEVVARRGITASTYDNQRHAAFQSTRDVLAADVDASTGVERSL
jgi:hypothetical protein